MSACSACGHDPVKGRFCPRCGVPASVQSPPPPPPGSMPPPARFPLYADQSDPTTPRAPEGAPPTVAPPIPMVRPAGPGGEATVSKPQDYRPGQPAAGPAPAPVLPWDTSGDVPAAGAAPDRERRAGWLPWAVAAVALVLAASFGAFLMTRDDGPARARDSSHEGGGPGEAAKRVGGDSDASDAGSDGSGSAIDLTTNVQAAAPATAPDGVDNDNRPVTFGAANMVDADPRTCWRMPGDGTGSVLTFTFPEERTISEVGLINGYAKKDPPDDWYPRNRRVLQVEWSFDDGTTITQDLEEVRTLQTIEVDDVQTTVVRLRLTEVSAPARGDAGRDFTPISDVSLGGTA